MRTKFRSDRKGLKVLDDGVLPRPLQRSAPREVTLSGLGWVLTVFAAGLVLGGVAGGPLLAWRLMEESARAAEVRRAGVPGEAVVTEVRRSREDGSLQVRIRYRYQVDGQEFTKRVRLRRNDPIGRTAQTGTRVRVVYLPSEPRTQWLEGYAPREQPVWTAAILPAAGIPGALLIIWVLRRQTRLLREGRAAMARVISIEKMKHHQSWRVTYTWELLSGASKKAHVDRAAAPTGSGAFVPVVYDADRPERHSVYPLSLVRLR